MAAARAEGAVVEAAMNGDQSARVNSLPPDGRSAHFSRLHTFQANQQREPSPLLLPQRHASPDRQAFYQPNVAEPQGRSFSPFQAYQNHIHMQQQRREYSPIPQRHFKKESFLHSPVGQRKLQHCESPLLQRRADDGRWSCSSASGSPVPTRNNHKPEETDIYNYENTSPILLQRFYHQRKQQQQAKEAEEAARNDTSTHTLKIQFFHRFLTVFFAVLNVFLNDFERILNGFF